MTALRALLLGLFTWSSYVALRTFVQRQMPFVDWPGYVRQDLVITLLRLSCAGICLWIGLRRWSRPAFGLGSFQLGAWPAWIAALLLCASMTMGSLSQARGPQILWVQVVESLIAVAVAMNEEFGFRGLFYCAVREKLGRFWAVLLPTLAFTAMHAGYQPAFHLPKVFLVGLALGLMRDRGASLPALVLLHTLLDLPFAVLLSGDLISHSLYYASAGVAGAAALAAYFSKEKALPGAGQLVFAYGSLKRGLWGAKELKMERRADWMGMASIQGELYDLGDYPGAYPGPGAIEGELWRLRDREFLAELDRFEGDEYLRDEIEVENARAWCWFLARRPEAPKILNGSWGRLFPN